MFPGDEPKKMLEAMTRYGQMGAYMKTIVTNFSWAQYFRAGDTPTVLYLIDKNHNKDLPEQGGWTGNFIKPFPETKPHYYTDASGNIPWDYLNPCNSWQHAHIYELNRQAMLNKRAEVYKATLKN
jgi:hypothetical protein